MLPPGPCAGSGNAPGPGRAGGPRPDGAAGVAALPDVGARPGAAPLPEGPARRAYSAYRRREARRLLELLPDGAVRPLYARARGWAAASAPGTDDPMEALVRFCEHLLPLPPFADWLADVADHREAHLDAAGRDPRFDRSPIPVAARRVGGRDEGWRAALNVFRDGDAWKGFVSFHHPRSPAPCRTADIFRESRADLLVERFLSFDDRALRAFLRSVLP